MKALSIIKKKLTRPVFLNIALLIIAVITGLILHCRENDWVDLISSCLFQGSLTALAISLLIDYLTKKDKEKRASQIVREVLIPQECPSDQMPIIYEIYQGGPLKQVLKNTLKAYTCNDYLSDKYLSFIDSSFSFIKRNEDYKVTICGKTYDDKYHIKQSLTDTIVHKYDESPYLKAFFVLKKNSEIDKPNMELDYILNDSRYVFREELEDQDFNDHLIRLCHNKDTNGIKKALNLNISLFDHNGISHGVLDQNIRVEPIRKIKVDSSEKDDFYGIEVRVFIPKEEFIISDRTTEDRSKYLGDTEYIKYTMRFEAEYPIPNDMNNFYLVFSRPTINPKFTLSFENIPNFSIDRVNSMSFISSDCDGTVVPNPHEQSFSLNIDGLVLPRSGVSFSWDFKNKLSEIEQYMVKNNLVDIQSINNSIRVNLVYSTKDNFTGKVLYKGLAKAYLLPELAKMLSNAQMNLTILYPEYHLLVYDAARPVSVQVEMFNYMKAKNEKPGPYVSDPANHSWHNYGAAVDVTIVNENGIPLDMGTKFDCFSSSAHIDKEEELVLNGIITEEQKKNRELLRRIMTNEGFNTIPIEWWHFQKYNKTELNKLFKLLDC